MARIPVKIQPIFYRLYHDDLGEPLFYSMEDLPGKYIDIDAETFSQGRYDVVVINGKIVSLSRINMVKQKLIPWHSGTPCDPTDVMIIRPDSGHYWKKHIYED